MRNKLNRTPEWKSMIRLDVLAPGRLERDGEGKVISADSTCILIRTDNGLIVVDPSTNYMRPMIKDSLRRYGVLFGDVSAVVLTHAHADHIQNLSLFPKAAIYIHEGEDIEIEGAIVVKEEEMQLVPGVRLVHTPGHTEGSMSVFVDADRRYVIAGDAIPTESNYRKMYPPAVNCNAEAALQSIKKIKRYADVIIPGHGFPFMARM